MNEIIQSCFLLEKAVVYAGKADGADVFKANALKSLKIPLKYGSI